MSEIVHYKGTATKVYQDSGKTVLNMNFDTTTVVQGFKSA